MLRKRSNPDATWRSREWLRDLGAASRYTQPTGSPDPTLWQNAPVAVGVSHLEEPAGGEFLPFPATSFWHRCCCPWAHEERGWRPVGTKEEGPVPVQLVEDESARPYLASSYRAGVDPRPVAPCARRRRRSGVPRAGLPALGGCGLRRLCSTGRSGTVRASRRSRDSRRSRPRSVLCHRNRCAHARPLRHRRDGASSTRPVATHSRSRHDCVRGVADHCAGQSARRSSRPREALRFRPTSADDGESRSALVSGHARRARFGSSRSRRVGRRGWPSSLAASPGRSGRRQTTQSQALPEAQ